MASGVNSSREGHIPWTLDLTSENGGPCLSFEIVD